MREREQSYDSAPEKEGGSYSPHTHNHSVL